MRFRIAAAGGATPRTALLVIGLVVAGVVLAPAASGEGRLAGSSPGVIQASSYPSAAAPAVAATAPGDRRTDAFDREDVTPQVALYLDANERGRLSAPAASPTASPAAGSGQHLDWPQLGVAFLLGAALALGLVLVYRSTRQRRLAL